MVDENIPFAEGVLDRPKCSSEWITKFWKIRMKIFIELFGRDIWNVMINVLYILEHLMNGIEDDKPLVETFGMLWSMFFIF